MNHLDKKLVEECFRKARITGDLSNSSIIKYRDSIKKYFSLIYKNIENLDVEDFENFTIKMQDAGASNSRIANVISAVKWLINNLQKNNMIKKTIDLDKIIKPKIGKKEVNYLEEEEIIIFLDTIKQDESKGPEIRKYRSLAFVILLFQTGARIGEVLSINIDDIDWQNKEIQIIGKGNKPRTLILTDNTVENIKNYLAMRKDKHEALFASLSGKCRWQQTDAGRTFRRYKKLSGIKKKFTIHTLRHTFATQYLMKGAGINVVQTALGHSDPVTTLKYYAGAVNKAKVKEMINDKFFDFIPESSLKNKATQ